MTVMLICEGRCNPTIREVDRQVALWRGKNTKVIGGPVTDTRLLWQIEHLQHTAHHEVSETVFRCDGCGATRQWGSTRALGVPPGLMSQVRP